MYLHPINDQINDRATDFDFAKYFREGHHYSADATTIKGNVMHFMETHFSLDYISRLLEDSGIAIKKIRESKGLTQLALSQAIGFKSVTIISCCEICYKNYHFNIEHLHKIAYVLDVPITTFFEDI